MAVEPDSGALQILRRIDAKLDRVIEDMQDLKVCTTNVERGLAGVSKRLDRLEPRQDRVERRLELSDAPRKSGS